MKELKVCFIGVGSIAKRHINNLRIIAQQRNINITIDALRRSQSDSEGIDTIFTDAFCLPDNYDVIFITNPTAAHLETLKRFHYNGKHFFIEKPVVSVHQIEDAVKLELKEDSIYYVACPLRYNAVIQYIEDKIDPDDVISVRSISSSYLPEWRPGKDYRETYSAHKDMGGGVSIDLIHEWDYLTYLFGWPQNVKCMKGKKSNLEIDSEDYAIYIAEYDNKVVELHLDYFGRKTIREIQLFTKTETIIGDIANNRIIFLKSGESIQFEENRDDYQRNELNHFLNMIFGEDEFDDGFHHGIKVLKLTGGKLE